MEISTIDHVNLRIPADGVDPATEFYGERLGFGTEGVEAVRSAEQPFFDVRLAPEHVLHLWPSPEFESPSGNNYSHVALVVDGDVAAIRDHLAAANVEVERELSGPLGATGRAPAVYVRDPFGYQVELKAAE